MLFKDLKSGYPIYIFDRDKVAFTQAKVLNVTPPHFDNHYGNPTEMVVDVSIEGFPKPYTFKENTDAGYMNNLVITTEREKALLEVENLQTQSEQAWNKRDTYKEIAEKCAQIRAEFSPAFKEKRENEERFSKLEGSVTELKDMIKSLVKELKG